MIIDHPIIMSAESWVVLIYLSGFFLSLIILLFFTDVGGWSEGGCGRGHVVTSVMASFFWPLVVLYIIIIYIRRKIKWRKIKKNIKSFDQAINQKTNTRK